MSRSEERAENVLFLNLDLYFNLNEYLILQNYLGLIISTWVYSFSSFIKKFAKLSVVFFAIQKEWT